MLLVTKVLVDKREICKPGGTKMMKDMCDRLARAGPTVLVQTGTDLASEYIRAGRAWGQPTAGANALKGKQHSKTAWLLDPKESYCVVGSTNWTTSSQANSEIDVLLRLHDDGRSEAAKWIRVLCRGATPYCSDEVGAQELLRVGSD